MGRRPDETDAMSCRKTKRGRQINGSVI